jgi:hypothetical protein
MFLLGSDPDLDTKLRRIQCRDLVERNLLALSAGVRRTLFWDLWHDTSERYDVMALMYGKLKMFDYANGAFGKPYPIAAAFSRMCRTLKGVKSVRWIKLPESPTVMLFEADCGKRGTVLVVWKRGQAFAEEPATTAIELRWSARRAVAQDVLGSDTAVQVRNAKVSLLVGATPVFVTRQ